ncbi:MAG: hypothetical protein ABI565_02895 [Vicinamibacteria bacterium]
MPPKKTAKPPARKTVETIRHEEAKRKNTPGIDREEFIRAFEAS